MPRRSGLASRLRSETADLHRQTEQAVGLPDSIETRADYSRLLKSSWMFYAAAQREIEDPRWTDGWRSVGVRVETHNRLPLLEDDLRSLGVDQGSLTVPRLDVTSFAQALGLLYVVEGSSLGGRFIGPAITGAIGDVPISFYLGEGRNHPEPWRAVVAGLAIFESFDTDVDGVLAGAITGFVAFGEIVSVAPSVVA